MPDLLSVYLLVALLVFIAEIYFERKMGLSDTNLALTIIGAVFWPLLLIGVAIYFTRKR